MTDDKTLLVDTTHLAATGGLRVAEQKFEGEASLWEMRSLEIAVQDQVGLDQAGEFLHDIKAMRDEIAATFDPIIKATNYAHKAAVAQKKRFDDPLEQADRTIRLKVSDFAREEQRKAREEAALLEAERREEEAKARRAAAELEAAGEIEQAQEMEQQAEELAAPPPVKAPAKTKGVAVREKWEYAVEDLEKLVRAVAEGTVPLRVLTADKKVLGQLTRSLKHDLNFPGVRTWDAGAVAVR